MGTMRCRAGEARQKDVLRRFYDEHCAKIQKMVPPDRLCIMRLGDGWEPLVRDHAGDFFLSRFRVVLLIFRSVVSWVKTCHRLTSHTRMTLKRCIWGGSISDGAF